MFLLKHLADFGNHLGNYFGNESNKSYTGFAMGQTQQAIAASMVAIAASGASLVGAVGAAHANISITIRLGSQPQYHSVPKYNNPYYSNYQRQNIYNIYNPRDRYYRYNDPRRVVIYNQHPDQYKPYKSGYRFRSFPYPVNVPAVNSGIYYR